MTTTDPTTSDGTPVEAAETDIAIVGMAGRFPGASNVDELWRRVLAGEDCLVDLTEEALLAEGVSPELLRNPDYVRRNGVLDDVESFDPQFFGIGPRDASIMDPQHRHFMECAWEALETSGHIPERFPGAIGVFAGCGMNTYFLNNLLTNPTLVDQVGMFLLRHTANDKDFLSTTLSYRLDLRGPSVNVQTACSTSLVAVHLAVQSLLAFECDLALAGGSTIEAPHRLGYVYQEGEVLSPDGVCRAFDAESGGTVLTSGAGVVALRRLADAIDEGDPILAVVKATAVNNDGQRKVGYLAPSVDGHADVIKEALTVAGLSGGDIQLFEAHGTGTAVGDPIEVAAATEAYRATTSETQFCRLVSTKPNIGHLDTAAGAASLIKTVQALHHRTLPPLANHTAPSPLLDLERSPFVLSSAPAEWPGDRPRRAGISSLGVGGTNAHAIVQEAPVLPPTPPAEPEQILVLSGQDKSVVDESAQRLAGFLDANPDSNLADVAYTLAGRRRHGQRRVVVATDVANAIEALRTGDRNRVATHAAPDTPPRVAFMFPGGGSQYTGMAAGLDNRFTVFHEVMADGIERVRRRSGLDLAAVLRADADPEALRQTTASLPAVFLTSVALARQWMAWGVEPDAFVGHSLGEYTAAHLAGVLTLDGALDLIVARAELIERQTGSGAAMLVVPLSADEVGTRLPDTLSLATINAEDECVVAGGSEAIAAFQTQLVDEGLTPSLIPLAAAAHSHLLEPILPDFLEVVKGVELSPPKLPYLSNYTGTWITAEQATSPQYWVDHLRHTVRFTENMATVLADGPTVLVELGPGHALSSYARRHPGKPVAAIPALRHPNQDADDTAVTLLAFARGWAAGLDVDIAGFAGTGRRTVRLPGYPFRRQRHWIEPGAGRALSAPVATAAQAVAAEEPAITRITDPAAAFWNPAWVDRPLETTAAAITGPWVVVGDPSDHLVAATARALTGRGAAVEVTASPHPSVLTPARAVVIVAPPEDGNVNGAVERWLTTASLAARALGDVEEPTLLAAVTRGALAINGAAAAPADALALGVIGTAPAEYPDVRTLLVDVEAGGEPTADAAFIVSELSDGHDRVVAQRGLRRLVPSVEPLRLDGDTTPAPSFRYGGTYLVTGGLGGVGFAVARELARRHDANLVVVASKPVPEGGDRAAWLAQHGYDDPTSRRIRRLAELEAVGTKVSVVTADLSDPASVVAAVDEAECRVGRLDGAVHAAGELRDRPIELATPDDHEIVIGAKARGALALVDVLRERGAELLVLISSTSTVLTPEGQSSYVAANSVLDALAGQHGPLRVVTINYGLWGEGGIAASAAHRARLGIEPGDPFSHPVLTEVHRGRNGVVQATGVLDAAHHWVIDEHRSTTGRGLLPGTGHVELYLAALDAAGLGNHALESVAFFEPLVVLDEQPVTARVTVTPGADGITAVLESDGGVGAWRMHSEAAVVPRPSTERFDVSPVAPDRAGTIDPLARPMDNLSLGPRWDSVVEAWRDGDVVGGRIRLPDDYAGEVAFWRAHPALVDVATAFAVALGDRDDALFVPIGYKSVVRFGDLPEEPIVRAVRTAESTADVLDVDLVLADPGGRVVLSIDGLSLRPIADPAALASEDAASHSDPDSLRRVAPLLALALEHGIRADEGADMLERVVTSGRPRLVASSVALDDLRRILTRPATVPAATTTEAAAATGEATVAGSIRRIWVDLLGVADIADDDDFFELGGHSLIAIRLMSRIHKDLGVRFQLATIFDASTVAGLASLVSEARPELEAALAAASAAPTATLAPSATPTAVGQQTMAPPAATQVAAVKTEHRSLVAISATGDKAPLFIVHGAGGNVLFLWSLARALSGSRPIYGFQAHGVDGEDMPDATIEDMAARYVKELREQHRGPYLLGGYSGGGIVTFEMVKQLRALGEDVRFVVMFDSVPPGKAEPPPKVAARNLAANIRRHGYEPLKPFIRRQVKGWINRVVPEKSHRVAQSEESKRELGMGDVHDLGFVNLFYYFTAAAERYQMSTIDVDFAVLKAEWVWPTQPHDYYWSSHINGTIDVAEVPGDHNAMFFPENAPRLADVLSEILDGHHL